MAIMVFLWFKLSLLENVLYVHCSLEVIVRSIKWSFGCRVLWRVKGVLL